MTEAGREPMLAPECLQTFVEAHAVLELGKHLLDTIARAAMDWTRQRT